MFKNLNYTAEKGIAYVKICKPSSLNALSQQILKELSDVFTIIENTDDIGIAILTGEGKAFAAGADISEMADVTGIQGQEIMKYGAAVMNQIENLSKPVIAAVNGYALGGGCELAMACDIRIASDKAQFGQPEVNLGIIPGFGGTQRLPRLIGKGMGKYLIFTGEYISASQALECGLVEKVVPHEQLLNECSGIAATILSKAPLAIRAAKLAVNKGITLDTETGIALESEACTAPFCSDDRIKGMKAFLEKTKPAFSGK